MLEHGFNTVCSLGILAEAGLALNGHACILGDLPQLICEAPESREENYAILFLKPGNLD